MPRRKRKAAAAAEQPAQRPRSEELPWEFDVIVGDNEAVEIGSVGADGKQRGGKRTDDLRWMLMAQLAEGAQWSTQRVRRCPGGSQTSNIMLLYHLKSVQCVGSHDSASGGALSAVKNPCHLRDDKGGERVKC